MKIIHVLNYFLPQQTAGTEVYVWALSKALMNEGHEVQVLIPNHGSIDSKDYNYDGISVHQFAEPSVVDRQLIMGFRKPEGLPFFGEYLQSEKPDIVHFHELAGGSGIGIEHIRVSKKYGAKVVMTFHLAGYSCQTSTLMYKGKTFCNGKINRLKCGSCFLHKKGLGMASPLLAGFSNLLNNVKIDTRTWGNSLGTALGTAYLIQNLEQNLFELFDICDQLVCISHWYEKTLSINGVPVNKLNYIEQGLPTPVGIDPIEFKKETNLRLLFLGRISPFKGLHLLLDALDSFSESDIQLSIYGNGDGSDYEIMLREKTINKTNVHWLGNLPQLKVQEVMQSHDLLCLCSTICEMSPLVIQEARAAKLPVLASNVYGNSEQMKEGAAGFLFEINNVESLKVKLALILKKRSVLQEQESKIKSPRSFQDLGASYEEVYKKTLNQ